MRRPRVVAAAAAAAVMFVAGTVVSLPAAADTLICEKYGSTTIQNGRYVVMNNVWGADTRQCINVTDTGFRITEAQHSVPTNGAPAGYPAAYWGCHYGNCSTGFNPVPATSANMSSITTSASVSYPSSGTYNAAYDIWFDPTPRRDGTNTGLELMVWLRKQGNITPVGGTPIATGVSLGGSTWDVYYGNHSGFGVVSYVRTASTTSVNFSIETFYADAVRRGYASRSWYLTSVQMGFEPWIGGAGLSLNNFSVTSGGTEPSPSPTSSPSPSPTSSPSPSPSPTQTTPPPSGSGACSASYRVSNSWNGGFTADVTVRNSGSSTVNSWRVTWTWPSGQTVTNMWNAAPSRSGSTQVASSLDYNGRLAPSASTSFGFQASGSTVTPTVTCTAG